MDQFYRKRRSVEITKRIALDIVRKEGSVDRPAIAFSIQKLEKNTYFQKNSHAAFFLSLLKSSSDKSISDLSQHHLMTFLAGHLLKILSQSQPVRSLNMQNLYRWYGRYTSSSKVGPNIIEFLKRLTPTQHESEDDEIVRRTFRSKLPRQIRKYRRRQFLSDNLRDPYISNVQNQHDPFQNHIENEKKQLNLLRQQAEMAQTLNNFSKFKNRRQFSRLCIQDHTYLFNSPEQIQNVRSISPINLKKIDTTNSTKDIFNKDETKRDIKTSRTKMRRILRGNSNQDQNSFRFLTQSENHPIQNVQGLTLQKLPIPKEHPFRKTLTNQ